MSQDQKKVAAWIAIGALCLAVGVAIWLSILVARSQFEDSGGEQLEIWRFVTWFMKQGAALNTIFATLLTALGVAVTMVSEVYKRSAQLVVLTVLCLAGIGACIFLMVKLDTPEHLAALRYYGRFADDAGAASAVNWMFGSLTGWFVAFLSALLGLSAGKTGGAVRRGLGSDGGAGDEPGRVDTQ